MKRVRRCIPCFRKAAQKEFYGQEVTVADFNVPAKFKAYHPLPEMCEPCFDDLVIKNVEAICRVKIDKNRYRI